MTQTQSNMRMLYYVLLSMLNTYAGAVLTVDLSDWRKASVFAVSILIAGATAARSYVDKSSIMVDSQPTVFFEKSTDK